MIRCFNLAEEYRTPGDLPDGRRDRPPARAGGLPATRGTSRERRAARARGGRAGLRRRRPSRRCSEFGDGGFVHVTGSTHKENGMRDVQTAGGPRPAGAPPGGEDRTTRATDIAMVDVDAQEGAKVGVLAYGATARPAKGAVLRARAEGHRVTFCRPVTIWPFPDAPGPARPARGSTAARAGDEPRPAGARDRAARRLRGGAARRRSAA